MSQARSIGTFLSQEGGDAVNNAYEGESDATSQEAHDESNIGAGAGPQRTDLSTVVCKKCKRARDGCSCSFRCEDCDNEKVVLDFLPGMQREILNGRQKNIRCQDCTEPKATCQKCGEEKNTFFHERGKSAQRYKDPETLHERLPGLPQRAEQHYFDGAFSLQCLRKELRQHCIKTGTI